MNGSGTSGVGQLACVSATIARAWDCTDSDVNALARSKILVSTIPAKFDFLELSLSKPVASDTVLFCINTGVGPAIMRIAMNRENDETKNRHRLIFMSLFVTIILDDGRF